MEVMKLPAKSSDWPLAVVSTKVPVELKAHLVTLASERGLSLSEYLKNLLKDLRSEGRI